MMVMMILIIFIIIIFADVNTFLNPSIITGENYCPDLPFYNSFQVLVFCRINSWFRD